MSPEAAKVFIAEDDEVWRGIEKRCLTSEGHEVVVEAKTAAEAISLIPQAVKLGVNVGVVDESIPSDPSDGQRVAQALREAIPNIKIVGVSGGKVAGTDVMMDKAQFDRAEFRKIVREL